MRGFGFNFGFAGGALAGGSVPAGRKFPTASNTGVPNPDVLTPYDNGVATVLELWDTAIIEDKIIDVAIDVYASNCILRRCKIISNNTSYTIRMLNDAGNLLIDQCEIDGNLAAHCVNGRNMTVRRTNMHNALTGVLTGSNTKVEDCYIHGMAHGSDTTFYGVRCNGGKDLLIRHNNIDLSDKINGSCVNLNNHSDGLSYIIVSDNQVRGGNTPLVCDPDWTETLSGDTDGDTVNFVDNVIGLGASFNYISLSTSGCRHAENRDYVTDALYDDPLAVPALSAVTYLKAANVGIALYVDLTYTNIPGRITYQWRRDGNVIAGATDRFYVPAAEDIGGVLTVTVVLRDRNGNALAQLTSDDTLPVTNYPNPTNTGVGPDWTPTTTFNGTLTISTPNSTLDGYLVNGNIIVNAVNVTIQNTKVVSNTENAIDIWEVGTQVLDCTIDGAGVTSNGIQGLGVIKRNDISRCENGIRLSGNGGLFDIQDNYLHNPLKTTGEPHYDGIAGHGNISGTAGILLKGNTIDWRDTSDIFLKNDFGNIPDVTIEANLLIGVSGYPVFVDNGGTTGTITNVTITGNAIQFGAFSYWSFVSVTPTLSGNFDAITGVALT